MSGLTRNHSKQGMLPRLIALLMASLVVLLALLAVSPELHERLHGDGLGPDHECAVTLFAQGVHADFDAVTAPLPQEAVSLLPKGASELRLTAPSFWLLPGRAPPGFGC